MKEFLARLDQAFRAGSPLLYSETAEDERLHKAALTMAHNHGALLLLWSSTKGIARVDPDGTEPVNEAAINFEALLQFLLRDSETLLPPDRSAIVLAFDAVREVELEPEVTRRLKDLFVAWEPRRTNKPRRMLLLSGMGWSPPSSLHGYVHTIPLPLPNREEIAEQFESRASSLAAHGITPQILAERAVGLPKLSIEQVVRQFPTSASSVPDPSLALTLLDQIKREEIRRTQILEVLTPITKIELGGFQRFKRWFQLRKDFFQRPGRPQLRPRGVLLLGFPGCGKSHAARWLAQEFQVPLVGMDIGQVQDRWVGSSEARMRLALKTLEAAAPLVLFIDEIEKSVQGFGTESTGVTTRIVGQLLTWLSDHRHPVFIVATANRPELPPELTRAGRFDAQFVVLAPSDTERQEIIRCVCNELGVAIDKAAESVLVGGSSDFSGAEVRQVLVDACYYAGFDKAGLSVSDVRSAIEQAKPLASRPDGSELLNTYRELLKTSGYLAAGEAQ